jgi:phage terminase large subunit GpA-like protein
MKELADGVCVLTMGVDTQDNRLAYEVVGWGEGGESWRIEYGEL